MNDIVNIISTVGFPISSCLLYMYYIYKDKNGSSNGRNTPIREIHVYSTSNSDGSITTLMNNKSDVYLTNVYNLINLENYLLTTNPNMTGWSKVDNKILTIESETMKILETKLK